MSAHVLLVDDDVELTAMLCDYLERDGFSVSVVHDGEAGVVAARSGRHDIVVLDVMMPGMSGMDALRCIRADSALPVLMLTARGDDTDRIVGLELGADDYVPKPCTPRELVARIRTILRRVTPQKNAISEGVSTTMPLTVDALTLWPEQRRATWNTQPLVLTCTEFNLLEVLARHVGQAVSKAVLSEYGLGRTLSRFDRSVDVHISSIRQKLVPMADGRSRIQTVFRKGYQLIRE
jgi:two-component system OmpR family response regulator/two-component system response regulator CpxR